MTVAAETPINTYTANGSTTVFAYTFRIEDSSEIKIYHDEVEQTSGFTVSGVGSNGGGSVTYTTAPASGTIVLFLREMPTTRTIDYQNSGDFRADTVNEDIDRVWLKLQEIERELNYRNFQFREEESRTPNINVLPSPIANQILRWDSDGSLKNSLIESLVTDIEISSTIDRYDSMASLIAASPDASTVYVTSYYGGWAGTTQGPKGGHYRHKTGFTNTSPSVGSAVSVSTIGTGNQTGLAWDASGNEWKIEVQNGFINVLCFGMDDRGETDVVDILDGIVTFVMLDDSLPTPPSTGAVDDKYKTVFFPRGKYLYEQTFNPPGNCYITFLGEGGKYFSSEFLQGFNGHVWELPDTNNGTFNLERIVFQGDNATYSSGAWSGLKTNPTGGGGQGDCVHMNIIECVFRDFQGVGCDLANIFSCTLARNIYGFNYGGGLRVTGGSSNAFLQETTQANDGFGAEIGGNGNFVHAFIEADCIRNNPAGENATFRALKLDVTNSEVFATVNIDDNSDKTPIEVTGGNNKIRIVFVDKGTATNWVTFGASATYNECHGGGFNIDLLTGTNSSIDTAELHNGIEGPNVRFNYSKTNDKGVIACSEPGVSNKDLDINGAEIQLNGSRVDFSATDIAVLGKLGSDQTATASTLGTVVRRLAIHNESGGLLGYIPIYNTIT